MDGIRLWVESTGEGAPLLLIPGLGTGNWLWEDVLPALAREFRVILPELRGSARSDKPDEPYTVERLTRDLAGVLDRFGIAKAHVLGASFGGFVAQHMAATLRGRVDRLVLVGTSLGGPRQIGPSGDILARTIRPRGRTRRERLEDGFELGFTPEWREAHADRMNAIVDWRLAHPQPEWAYYRQLLAGWGYDGEADAPSIGARTLICAAETDPVVPVANAYALRDRIRDAAVTLFPGRHLFLIEHADAFADVVTAFLRDGVVRERA